MSNNNLIVTNVDDPDAIHDAIIRFQTQGKSHSEAQRIWRWRYVNGIAGRAIISLVWDGEKIVGHNALALVDFVAGSKKFKIGMSGGTMVDEDYRGRGIYRMLRNREYETAISRNVPMLLGFPNKRLLPLALKTGSRIHHIPEIVYKPLSLTKNLPLRDPWGLIVNIGRYISSRDQARKERGSQKARNKSITVKEITSFGDETKILWEKLIRSEYVGIQKDVSYLHWRYVLRPNTCFRAFVGFIDDKPSSLCVIEWDQSEISRKVGFVSELLGDILELESAVAALKCAEKAASDSGIIGLMSMVDGVSVSGPVTNELSYYRSGFRPFTIKIFDERCRDEAMRPWQISMGDHMMGRGLSRE